MGVEDLFAGERALDRPAGGHRQLGDHDLVREGIGLATEAATMDGAHHPDPVHRQFQHLGQRPVHVVHDLGRGPQRQAPVHPLRDGRVLLHGEVGVALEEEEVLADVGGAGPPRVQVPELVRLQPVDVAGQAATGVDPLVLRLPQPRLDRHHGLQRLVLDPHRLAGSGCSLLVDGGDRRHRVAHVAHLLRLQRALVLGDREDAEADGQVLAGDHGLDARDPSRRAGVDRQDAGVRVRAAQDLAVQHSRQRDVVRVDGGADQLGRRIGLGERPPDDVQPAHRLAVPRAAISTASTIFE